MSSQNRKSVAIAVQGDQEFREAVGEVAKREEPPVTVAALVRAALEAYRPEQLRRAEKTVARRRQRAAQKRIIE